MAEWEHSYGGPFLRNARFLTEEEINERYPLENTEFRAQITRQFVNEGYDIIYGEYPNISHNFGVALLDWAHGALITAAYLYETFPWNVHFRALTDMSNPKATYAAVKKMN